MDRCDVLVIGTGGMGAAAAMHAAARGARVCGLDRFPPGHAQGSSHGQSRLIRLAYFEHPAYVPLLRRAYALWRDLEAAVGRPLLVESGLVLAGPAAGDVVSGTLRAAEEHALQVERLRPVDVMARWPALRLPDEWTAVYESCAGYLFVEECVAAHAEVARRHGARLEHDVCVRGWRTESGAGGVVVDTDRGTYRADKLVVTAGPWADRLIRLPAVPLEVLRKPLFWYGTGPAATAGGRRERPAGGGTALHEMPCFGFDTPGGFFYGFPPLDDRGLKIAEHTGGASVTDPSAVDRRLDTVERERVEAVISAHLPIVTGGMTDHAVCLYTMSPDGHFVVGHHPDDPRVSIAAGFSGHGFKFASVMGEILADLALDGSTRHPVGFLAPTRFGSAPGGLGSA